MRRVPGPRGGEGGRFCCSLRGGGKKHPHAVPLLSVGVRWGGKRRDGHRARKGAGRRTLPVLLCFREKGKRLSLAVASSVVKLRKKYSRVGKKGGRHCSEVALSLLGKKGKGRSTALLPSEKKEGKRDAVLPVYIMRRFARAFTQKGIRK